MLDTKRAILLAALVSIISMSVFSAGCRNTESGGAVQKEQTQNADPAMSTPITAAVRYVALGDSTGAGVGAREGGYVARLFKRIAVERSGSTLVNLCVSGATTSDVLRGQLGRGVAADPNLVTLGIGINDIGHGFALEEFAKNYDAILRRLKEGTRATIVVSNLPDISSAPRIPSSLRSEYQQRIIQFNDKLHEVASRHGVIVFDVFTITHAELASHPEYFSADGFHPSDQGYELWAEQMWPTIAQIIGTESKR